MKTAENKNQNQKENKNLKTKEYKMKSIVTMILAVILTANLNAQWGNDYNSYDSYGSSSYFNKLSSYYGKFEQLIFRMAYNNHNKTL
jgi:hypothetical protein